MKSLQTPCFNVWDQKYRLKLPGNSGFVEDTVEDMFSRVSFALASQEPEEHQQQYADIFFEAMDNGAFPAGRILSNIGAEGAKPSTSAINCTVSGTIDDSMDSIFVRLYEAAMTLKAGCGIGYEFSSLRPRGALVTGCGSTTSGPLSFMEVFDRTCFTVSSAGGRRGAQMATFDIKHPDVIDYIKSKEVDGALRQFNLSVLITDEFIDAVRKDLLWELSWKGEVYRSIKARDLWDLIMKSTYERADPGFILIDRVNQMNNLWFCENIRATNPCFAGDTLIAVADHRRAVPIKRLAEIGENVPVYCHGDSRTQVRMARAPRKTGNKMLYKVTLDNRDVIRVTEDHKWTLCNHQIKETKDLEPGDCLVKFVEAPANVKDAKLYYNLINIFLTMIKRLDRMPFESEVLSECKKLIQEMVSVSACNHLFRSPKKVYEYFKYYLYFSDTYRDTTEYKSAKNINVFDELTHEVFSRKDPINTRGEPIITRNFESYSNFLLYTEKTTCGTTTSGFYFNEISKMVAVATNHHKQFSLENWDNFKEFFEEEGFVHIPSNVVKVFFETDEELRASGDIGNHSIRSVEPDAIEDVYNLTVDQYHNVAVIPDKERQDRGIFINQCGEQPLPPGGSCLLGSINLVKFVVNPFTDDAYFDFDKFESVVAVFTRMLDNVVELNGLPLPQQREEIMRKRRHGMGFLGLGSALVLLKMKYGSREAVEFTEKMSRILAITGFKVGVELAKEKGPAPIMEEAFELTEEAKARNSNVRSLDVGTVRLGKEWLVESHYFDRWRDDPEGRKILEDIRKHGCRFTHHTSIAPTGTLALSIGNNVSNGIEPTFAHRQLRNIVQKNKKTKEQVDLFSYEFLLWREHMKSQGVNKSDEDLLNDLPDFFVDANTVPPTEHVDMQAAAQRWVDSSISKTINVDTNYTYSDFQDIYLYAHEKGLKGCTTYRYNPGAFTGVLVKKSDLERTPYFFKTKSGELIQAKGTDIIVYDDEEHVAANLHEALKDGYYGKF